MKRILLVPIAALVLLVPALASAAGLTFNYSTGNFDFTDSAIDTGYIGFAMNGDQIDVNVSSQGSISAIPSLSLVVYGPTTDATGNDVYPTFGQLKNVTLYGSNGSQGFDVTHGSANVGTVASDYATAFTSLGFKADELATSTANVITYTFTKDNMQLRAVFHQMGSNVTAHVVVDPAPAA